MDSRAVSRPDLIGAGIVVVIGAFMMIVAPSYKLHDGAVIGPGFVPFLFGAAMVVFGVATAIGVLLMARSVPKPQPSSPGSRLDTVEPAAAAAQSIEPADGGGSQPDSADDAGPNWRRGAAVFGLTLVAVALTPLLGIAVAFGIVIFAMLWLLERERWWLGLLVAAAVSIALYLLFVEFLQIPIPIGPWGF